MSAFGVMRQIQQWYIDRDTTTAWIATATSEELLERAQFPISPDEATAIHDRRIDSLSEAGVHAFSLIQLSRLLGFDVGERWSELSAR